MTSARSIETARENDELFRILQTERLTAVVDIGANPVEGAPPYKPMMDAALCSTVGFEPQQDALAALIRAKGPLEDYLPYVIGDGRPQTLHVCAASGMTSLLKPDLKMLSLFHLFPGFGKVEATVPVETKRLDDITEIEQLDFLKIDIQGGELSVFRSGRQKLAKAVVIQTEISFMTLYENQPTFGEVDLELREQGFVPHCFANVKRWGITPMLINNNPRQGLNQLLEADIVYVRDFSQPESMSDEQLKHLVLVAHHCYNSSDLALHCLLLLERRGGVAPGVQQRYLQLLS